MPPLQSYTFVALDLETTGLSQEHDTIIEVAAVKFQLEYDGISFRAIHIEERSMLIDPEREIEEHISMITGISNEMVRGKAKWHEVRERVASFIGEESIIVGHNVLFDVSMLDAHGIDLKHHKILDTFELSEIFSGDAESLNLGFLAKKYGFDDGSEHRALDDTKLSLHLFLYYLSEVSKLDGPLLSLWEYTRKKDESDTIDTLLLLVGNMNDRDTWYHEKLEYKEITIVKNTQSKSPKHPILYSISPEWNDEKMLIDESVKKGKVLILTSSKKQTSWLALKLSEYRVFPIRERSSYISLRMLAFWLEKNSWKRKETILIIRLVHWVFETKTGIIDELKWYGDELNYKYLFTLSHNEITPFLEGDLEKQEEAEILIAESYNHDTKHGSLSHGVETCIIRDVVELEKSLRYRDTFQIDWNTLERDLRELSIEKEQREDLLYALSVLEEIITSVVERPSGPNIFPPGDYGETYFFTQKDLWHRGYIWLIWAIEKLEGFIQRDEFIPNDREIIAFRMYNRLVTQLRRLIRLARIAEPNQSIILEIKNGNTRLSLFSRNEIVEIQNFIELQGGRHTLCTGYQIHNEKVRKFLQDECGLPIENIEVSPIKGKFSQQSDSLRIEGNKVVILGTNLKHLRSMATTLKSNWPKYEIYTQGVSGGKSKILHLFQSGKKAILIGLIDTWKDESTLWEIAETLCITKIPFDPPSDPSYLARTVGMSNNFENYSIPLAINTINTLIGRARSANSTIEVFLCDEKLTTMTWGKNIAKDFL